MWHTWWSAKRIRTSVGASGRSHKHRQLYLEAMEDRLLLAVRTWSGAAAGDSNWNTTANWAENVVPVAGDDLVFPAGAARLVNVNNLTAGTTFLSLSFTGGGYVITGNAVGVGANGITNNVAGAASSNSLNLPLTLTATRTVTVTGSVNTLILGDVLSGAGGLTKAGDGTLQLAGTAANTYTGVTTVNAGILELNKTAGILAVPGDVTVGDGTGTDLVRFLASDQIAAAGSATIASGGTLALNAFSQTLAGLGLTGGTALTTTGTLTLAGNVTVNAAATSATISGNLALGTAARTFTVADGAASDDLVIAAVLGGSGDFIKSGPGKLVLSGANTHTGSTTVQAGTLNLRNAAALGATSAGTTVASQAILEVQGGISIGMEALTFAALAGQAAGTLRNVSDNNAWAGALTITEDALFDTTAGQLTLTGVLSGGGATRNVTKRGAGTLIYGGTAANTYAGTTTVAEGVLQLNKTSGVDAIAGNLVVGDGTGNASSDVVQLSAANQIADTAQITVATSGLLDLNGQAETVGPLTLTGGTVATGTATLTLTGNVTTTAATTAATISGNLALGGATRTFTVADGTAAEDLVLSAVVSGAAGAGLTKEGPGTMRLGGANTYTGATTVNAGSLLVNGAQSGSSATVAAGATLGGTGTVGALTASGTVAPGATGPGILNAGNVTFNATATFRVEINGTTPGTGHDQLNVTGTVNLGNATLASSLGFVSVGGTNYVILANDGADVVTGTFNGLAEGATLTINNRPFRISYRGGDGNDVVLTDASIPTTTTLTSSASTSVFGQSVTFTAVVAPTSGAGTPTGTVTFRDGMTTLGTGTLASGRATFTTTTLAIGSRQLTAVYEADSTFSSSTSTALTQTVNKANTTTVVTATPNPATLGQAVLLSATVTVVSPGAGTPTGTVTFRDGATVLGTGTVTAGVATFSTSALTAGSHSITASYGGDANFETSTSAAVTLQVGSALSVNQRFVSQLYLDLLQRQVEAGGLTFWSGQLDSGVSRTDVTLAISASIEYRTLVVRGLFQRYLRRDAEPGGLATFVGFLGSGGTVERTAAAIVASAEYFANRGGSNNTGWLTAIYQDVFTRAVDGQGQAAHLAGLAAGFTRQRIAEVIFTSDESHRLDVRGFYQRFLRREPDAGGLSAFVAALTRGARQEQVIATIAGSAEYLGRL